VREDRLSGQYIGLDLGTTGVKAGLFGATGEPLGLAYREFRVDSPAPGLAEFDAARYAELAFEAIREVLAAPGARAAEVRGLGLSSQAQTFVLLGEDGRPVRPAVSWLDVRAGAEAGELSALAGRPVDAITSAPKLLWLRRREAGVVARARRFLVIPDYLIWLLSGRAATDPGTAASTGAYLLGERRWDPAVLAACALEPAMLPDVLLPGEAAGKLSAHAARELGLPADALVAVGANDQGVGALGAGNVDPGCASMALGTALALIATAPGGTAAPPGVGLALHPAGARDGSLVALLAYAKTAGVVLRWFRDGFAPGAGYEVLFREAAAVPPGAQGLTCLPHFSGTATPDFNPAARGAFAGLSLAHGRAHLFRALVESLCFTVRENAELLGRAVRLTGLRAIGGGARSDVWLQMIADVTGLVVERPRVREAACLGAAELAMCACGRFGSVAEASRSLYAAERRFEPDAAARGAYDAAWARYRRLRAETYGTGST
jgi:xylulokinase